MAKSSSIPSHSSPSNLGYRMTAEWETHQATWLSWPDDSTSTQHLPKSRQSLKTYSSGALSSETQLEDRRRLVIDVIRSLAMVETVHVNVNNAADERAALRRLGSSPPNVVFHHFPTDTIHCRDYGATFVCCRDAAWRTPPLVAIDWGFVADGDPGKNTGRDWDEAIPMSMARVVGVPCISGGLNLHGSDIDANGRGVLLASDRLQKRNPDFDTPQIEQRLAAMLGITDVVWLARLADTGQTDTANANRPTFDVARFVNEDTVVISAGDDTQRTSRGALDENQRTDRLQQHSLNVVSIPTLERDGRPQQASYLSFYLANGLILMPKFQRPSDEQSRARLAELFPDRTFVDIVCDPNNGLDTIRRLAQPVPSMELVGS